MLPQALVDEPSLSWVLSGYARSYLDLDRRRQGGYATGQPLAPADILAYGYSHGYGDDIEFFFKCVSAMDDEYLKDAAEKAERKSKAGKGKSPPRKGRKR